MFIPALARTLLGAALISQTTAITLGRTLNTFAILAYSAVSNSGSDTLVDGNLGVSPGISSSVTGFEVSQITGAIYAADETSMEAKAEASVAYTEATALPGPTPLTGKDLADMVLGPGVYSFASSAQLSGGLTFDGGGDPDAVFVIAIGSTLTTAVGSSMSLTGGARACRIFWAVGSSATINGGTQFLGTIVAQINISVDTESTVDGGLYALNGAVAIDQSLVSAPMMCADTTATSTSTFGTGTTAGSTSSAGATGSAATTTEAGSTSSAGVTGSALTTAEAGRTFSTGATGSVPTTTTDPLAQTDSSSIPSTTDTDVNGGGVGGTGNSITATSSTSSPTNTALSSSPTLAVSFTSQRSILPATSTYKSHLSTSKTCSTTRRSSLSSNTSCVSTTTAQITSTPCPRKHRTRSTKHRTSKPSPTYINSQKTSCTPTIRTTPPCSTQTPTLPRKHAHTNHFDR